MKIFSRYMEMQSWGENLGRLESLKVQHEVMGSEELTYCTLGSLCSIIYPLQVVTLRLVSLTLLPAPKRSSKYLVLS